MLRNGNNLMGEDTEKTASQIRFKRKYLLWFVYAVAAFFVGILLCDKVIMPLYTKHGNKTTMPNVTGMLVDKAEKILRENGFKPILEPPVFSESFAKNQVISQNPLPNSTVKKGRRTYLTVSKGEKYVIVPDIVYGSPREAEIKLRSAELIPGRIEYRYTSPDSNYPKGVVMGQSITGGDTVSVGDSIHFMVSLGDMPENVIVPDLVGKSLQDAKEIIKKNGLNVGKISFRLQNDLIPNTVIFQSVEPNSIVDVGQEIDLDVSELKEEEE